MAFVLAIDRLKIFVVYLEIDWQSADFGSIHDELINKSIIYVTVIMAAECVARYIGGYPVFFFYENPQ